MGKVSVRIPFVTWRDGRPRYFASPRHRQLGFRGEDLRHPDGTWFTLEEAIAWSEQRAREVEARAGQRRPRPPRAAMHTLGGLMAEWFREPRMNGRDVVEGKKRRAALALNTVADYRHGALIIERFDEGTLWSVPVAAITARTWAGVIDRIEAERGLHQARRVRRTVSAFYSWAVRRGRAAVNPFLGLDLDLPLPPPRVRYGSIAEMQHLVATADALGRHDVGDAIVLGLWTGQRQNDRLALVDAQETRDGILVRQLKKHRQPLLIPAAPELKARLKAMRARRRGWRVNYPHIVLDETRRAPFADRWSYSRAFAAVREAAVRGIRPDGSLGPAPSASAREPVPAEGPWTLAPMPSLADFHDQDLRDTAVTWLALAGCDEIRIASITGHSLGSVKSILKHYLGFHPELARSAIARLAAWYDEQGEG